jgi:hypothetical protein
MTDPKHLYQQKLLEIGEALGYRARRSFKKSAMGDVVWLERRSKHYTSKPVPVVAFEILSFEVGKEIRDCVMTLQTISPALGVLVIIEEAYAKLATRFKRYDETTYPQHIRKTAQKLADGIALSLRVEIWDESKVDRLHKEYVEERLRL